MNSLCNARHEAFARLLVEGRSQADAYREIYPQCRAWKSESVHEKASKLTAKVRPRVNELQTEIAKRVVIEKTELVRFLAAVVWTPVDSVGATSPLAQEVEVRTFGDGVVTKIRMPSKLGAVSEIAKLLGLYEPERQEQTVRFKPDSDVLELLRS